MFIPKCFRSSCLLNAGRSGSFPMLPSAPTCCLKASGSSSRPRQGPPGHPCACCPCARHPNHVLAVCLFTDTWSFRMRRKTISPRACVSSLHWDLRRHLGADVPKVVMVQDTLRHIWMGTEVGGLWAPAGKRLRHSDLHLGVYRAAGQTASGHESHCGGRWCGQNPASHVSLGTPRNRGTDTLATSF